MLLMLQWSEKLPQIKNKRIYKGRSMQGTFRFGDHLMIESVPLNDIRPGDVVVYRRLNHKGVCQELVHRVMCTRSKDLIVRGDRNACNDSTPVTEEDLVGRVSHLNRNGKIYAVRGKTLGLLRARILHGSRHIREVLWNTARRIGRGSYHCLRQSGLIARLWRPSVVKVQLMTEDGPLVKYVCRNRTVAYHWVNEDRFKCRKPYDLVLFKDRVPGTNVNE
jgi:signal peptidase I